MPRRPTALVQRVQPGGERLEALRDEPQRLASGRSRAGRRGLPGAGAARCWCRRAGCAGPRRSRPRPAGAGVELLADDAARPRRCARGSACPPTSAWRRAASRAGRGGCRARRGACAGRRAGRRGRPSGPRRPPCAPPCRRAGRRAVRTASPACPAIASTARMIAAIAASCASSLATVSSSRSASTLTSVRSGSSDSRLRMVPSASSAARRAWISSSESKICCCSLSRISAARMSMPRMRSNDMAVSALMARRSFLLCGKGSASKCSDPAESPARRVPVWSRHPRSEQFRPPKTPARRCSTVTGCLYPRPCR